MKKTSAKKHAVPDTPPEPAASATTEADQAATDAAGADQPAAAEPAAALEAARAEAAANYDKFLRATADLENYRKRAAREKDDLARYTREEIIGALLPVLDNLERAIQAAREHGDGDSSLLEGVAHIHKLLKRTLEECGLVEITSNCGHPFDPEHHEAVGHVESDDHGEGVIINQVQRGYTLSNRLLRPARVVVSKGPAEETDS